MSCSESSPESVEQIDGACRLTIGMTTNLLEAIDARCAVEDKKRSLLISEILELILMSQTSVGLHENAAKHERSLVDELEQNLLLFKSEMPIDAIEELAEASQRSLDQMLIQVILMGLKVYQRSTIGIHAEIASRAILSEGLRSKD
jgi:hypothetical protein